MAIKVLPDHVINQISAGEVIDRPASVVRELVDNAVDAGASEITIYLEEGGKSLIRCYDNGSGMDRDDLLLAFERHATSKLSSVKDLTEISTLGFRGEALPSIASVAKVLIKSRTAAAETGNQLQIEGGEIKKVSPCAGSIGTDIEIRKLFFNTPARRKFLREPRTESLRVKQWLTQASLAHPSVRYRLFCDNREVLNLPRRESATHRAQAIFRGSTLPLDFERNTIRIRGLVGHPAQAQADAKSFVILVNGRLVVDRAVLRALKDGFDSMLKEREFPVGFVSIDLPPRLVDVNVHPQKSEVRFRYPQEVFLAVKIAVQEAVRAFKQPVAAGLISRPVLSLAVPKPYADVSKINHPVPAHTAGSAALELDLAAALKLNDTRPDYAAENLVRYVPENFRYGELHYIGQLLGCYLLCELEEDFIIVDMHAAHERCNYNRIRSQFNKKKITSQQLLVSEIVEVGEERAHALAGQSELLERYGFHLKRHSPGCVEVTSVPSMIPLQSAHALVRELASLACEYSIESKLNAIVDAVAARIACHASIRSGDGVTPQSVRALFDELDMASTSSACPHGRPVSVRFTRNELERWFGRIR